MFILAMLFDVTNKNLLLGFMPESLGLLIFGIALIAFAVGLRWLFNRTEETNEKEFLVNQTGNFKREN